MVNESEGFWGMMSENGEIVDMVSESEGFVGS